MDDFKKFDLERMDKKITKKDLNSAPAEYDNVVPTWVWLVFNTLIGMLSIFPFGGFVVIIVYIILSFVDVNANLKNYSRASLIVIGLGLLFILIVSPNSFRKILRYLLTGVF